MTKDRRIEVAADRTLRLELYTPGGVISYRYAAATDDEHKQASAIVGQGMSDILGKLLALGGRR